MVFSLPPAEEHGKPDAAALKRVEEFGSSGNWKPAGGVSSADATLVPNLGTVPATQPSIPANSAETETNHLYTTQTVSRTNISGLTAKAVNGVGARPQKGVTP